MHKAIDAKRISAGIVVLLVLIGFLIGRDMAGRSEIQKHFSHYNYYNEQQSQGQHGDMYGENSSSEGQNNRTSLNVFSNNYLKITVLPGWIVKSLPDGSIKIFREKGNYILYINPHFYQASGIKGARLDEILNGSPSGDLVVKFHPAEPCIPAELDKPEHVLKNGWKRYSLYVSSNSDKQLCNTPTDGVAHWYFSFYVSKYPYVTYIKGASSNSERLPALIITVSKKADSINNLPQKEDPTLLNVLKQVDQMVDSIRLLKGVVE